MDVNRSPAEDHPLYREWWFAHDRLAKATEKLESMWHVHKDDRELRTAHAQWCAAKMLFDSVCAKTGKPVES